MPGRAEGIRLLLRHAGVKFVDHRIKFEEWKTYKPTFELKQLPVLVYGKEKMAQTNAILQFLGKKYGYMPSSPEEHYEALSAMNTFEDIFSKAFEAFGPMNPTPDKAKQEEFVKNDLPLLAGFVEKKLEGKEDKDYLIGSRMTVPDFYILGIHAQLSIMPPVKDAFEKVAAPLLKAYVKKRLEEFNTLEKCKPKLYYFDLPARGEMIRLLLRHAKIDFEDIRIKMPEWPAKKDSFPLKQLPMFEYQGKKLCQTDSIMHSLGLKFGYLPLEPLKYAKVIETCGMIKDLFSGYTDFVYAKIPDEMKKKKAEEYFSKKAPLIMSVLEKRLKSNKTQDFFVGAKYTLVDFYMICAAKWVILNPMFGKKDFEGILKTTPALNVYLEKRFHDFP